MQASPLALEDLITAPHSPQQHFTLPNGLAVHFQQDRRSPLVCVHLYYHVGSSHEAPGHTNLSHVLEHMIFEGSEKLATGQYLRVIEWLGGSNNAQTLQDATVYTMVLPASRLEVALEILADTMINARLSERAFEKARTAVRDERRLKIDNRPVQQAIERHHALAHGTSPYGTPHYGQARDLEDMSLIAIRTWYRNRYAPNNATLVVVGDVEADALQRLVERHFAAHEAVPLPPPEVPRHATPLHARSQSVTLPGLRDGLLMAFNVPSLATCDELRSVHALRIVAELLGRGASSLLYSQLVRGQHVMTAIDPSYDYQVRGDTLLNFAGYVAPGHTPAAAEQAVWDVIDGLRTAPVSAQHIENAKFHLLAQHAAAQASLTGQADAIGWSVIGGTAPALRQQHLRTLASITEQDIQHAIDTYLTRERSTVTHLCAVTPVIDQHPVLTCADLSPGIAAVDMSALMSAQGLPEIALDGTQRPLQQWHTAQGSKVCFVASAGAPMFDLQLRFKAGACHDGDTPGLAALTLYMLDQGGGQWDAAQIAERFKALGATFSRNVTPDDAILRLRCPAHAGLRSDALALLTAVCARPSFEPTALERMRTRVLNYVRRREAKAQNRLNVETLRLLYAAHPYTQDHHGTVASLATLDRQQILAFHQRAYSAANLEITLVADLPHEQAQALLASLSQAFTATEQPLPTVAKAQAIGQPGTLRIEEPGNETTTDNVTLKLAFAVDTLPDDPHYPALLMANQIVGGSFQSRLVSELRERRALTYAIHSRLHHYRAASVLIVSWDIQPQYLDASLELVRLVLRCFIEQGPNPVELDMARSQLLGKQLRTFADDEELATLLAEINAQGLPADHCSGYSARLAQVSAAQVQAAARQAFDPNRCVVVSVGPNVAQKPLPALVGADH